MHAYMHIYILSHKLLLHEVNEKSRKHKLITPSLYKPRVTIYIYIYIYILLINQLAAVAAHSSRCTSLVCSCYVPARNSDSKDEESMRTNISGTGHSSRSSRRAHYFLASKYEDIDGVSERRFCSDKSRTTNQLIKISSSSSSGSARTTYDKENCIDDPIMAPLKSNLKKGTSMERDDRIRMETRKVSWPDSLGKDIAHVQEFEPSVSEVEELKSTVRNSCICAIQ